jgi:LacI family transcriptional regulator
MRKLQLEDLSKKLGYSKTLISMVLNGKGNKYGISKKTQAIVLEAMSQLDYTPNKFAKSLRTGKSYFVGLIVSDISNPFYSTIAKNIESVLFESDYHLMVCSTEEVEAKEMQLVDTMVNQQAVDGLIIATSMKNAEFYEQARFSKLPIVFIDRLLPNYNANYVSTDNRGGAKHLVQHLIKDNYKRIACLAITPQYLSTISDRLEGYREALAEAGFKKKDEVIKLLHFENIQEDVEASLLEFKTMKEPPEAVFALNNNIAVAVLRTLQKEEFSSLSKLRVTCFDDIETFDIMDKKVISVSQPTEEMGKRSSELIMDLIAGRASGTTNIVLPTQLIVR